MLSGLLVLASVFLPVSVATGSDLAQVGLGAPLPFVLQDQTIYDPPLPWRVRFYSPLEVPTWVLWPQFLPDVALVFGVIIFALHIFRRTFLKTPQY